jgi:hypothetical protein
MNTAWRGVAATELKHEDAKQHEGHEEYKKKKRLSAVENLVRKAGIWGKGIQMR